MSYTPLPVNRPPSGTFANTGPPVVASLFAAPSSTSWAAAIAPSRLDFRSHTYRIMLFAVLVYVLSSLLVRPLGYIAPTPLALLRIGSVSTEYIQCAAVGYVHELRRIVFSICLSSSILGLLFTLIFLYLIGPRSESLLGGTNYIKLLVYSGAFSNLFVAAAGSYSLTGWSGAYYALLASEMMRYYLAWAEMGEAERFAAKQRVGRMCVFMVIYELLVPNFVLLVQHASGFLAGACIGGLADVRTEKQCKTILAVGTVIATGLIYYPVIVNIEEFRQYCWELQRIYV